MNTKVLVPKKVEFSSRVVPKLAVVDSFEKDWKNGISGEEVLKRVYKHIDKLYASRAKK